MEHCQMHMNYHVMRPRIIFGQSHAQMKLKLQIPPQVQAYPQGYPGEVFPPGPIGSYPPSILYGQHQLYHQQQLLLQQPQVQHSSEEEKAGIDEEFEADVKSPALPLARIKRIMRADEEVRMIAHETPVLFNKACEMFIIDLTQRSWKVAEENKRKTVNKRHIMEAISRKSIFDFLDDIEPLDVVPRSNFEPQLNKTWKSVDRGGSTTADPGAGGFGSPITPPRYDDGMQCGANLENSKELSLLHRFHNWQD